MLCFMIYLRDFDRVEDGCVVIDDIFDSFDGDYLVVYLNHVLTNIIDGAEIDAQMLSG
jgi:hypothetical protein